MSHTSISLLAGWAVAGAPLAAMQIFNIPLPKFLLCVGIGTVAAILIYDALISPKVRREAQRQARDEVRASLGGGASGAVRAVGSGVSVSALPADAASSASAPAAATAAGGDPSGSAVHRLDEYARSLREQQQKLDADRKSLMEERTRLEALRRDVESDRERVDARERDVSEARVALEARRAALEAAAVAAPPGAPLARSGEGGASLDSRSQELEAEREAIARERADAEARRLSLDQRERAQVQQQEDVERERGALLDMRKQLASRQESIDQMQRRYAQLLVALEREHAEAARLPEPVRAALESFRQEGGVALQTSSPAGPPAPDAAPAETPERAPADGPDRPDAAGAAEAGEGEDRGGNPASDPGPVAAPEPAVEGEAPAADEEDAARGLVDAFYSAVPRGTPVSRADAMLARLVVEEELATEDEVGDARALQERAPAPAPNLGAILLAVGVLDAGKLRRILDLQARRLGRGRGAAGGATGGGDA